LLCKFNKIFFYFPVLVRSDFVNPKACVIIFSEEDSLKEIKDFIPPISGTVLFLLIAGLFLAAVGDLLKPRKEDPED
jgi:hypothetical protein